MIKYYFPGNLLPAFALTLLTIEVVGQAPNPYPQNIVKNFVRTWEAAAPITDPAVILSSPVKDVRQTTQYIDGIGRPLQLVAKQGSMETGSSPVDIVSPIMYDQFSREQHKYLAYPANSTGGYSTNDGEFKLNPFAQQAVFMSAQYNGQNESHFYGKTNFEASPLSRIEKSMNPGINGVGSNRGVQMKYWLNTTGDAGIRIWTVINGAAGAFGTYSSTASYNPGELYKNVNVDEHDKQIIEFKDKEGKVILRKVQLTSTADDGTGSGYAGWICTYYIYDNLNNLRCVIQPQAIETMANANSWVLDINKLDEQCFRYEYDSRNRMIIKKIPGAAPVYMVYDKRDRLVMSRDGNLASSGKWMVTLYDDLNRPLQTGLWTNSGDITTHSVAAANPAGNYYYPFNESSVPVSGWEMLTKTHYDNYDNLPSGLSASIGTISGSQFYPPSNLVWPYPQVMTQSNDTKGLVTWTQVKVLNSSPAEYISTINIYDNKGRKIYTKSLNINGRNIAEMVQYSWAGQVLMKYSVSTTPVIDELMEEITKMEYDDLGRLIATKKAHAYQKGNSQQFTVELYKPEQVITQFEYDKLGKLKNKKIAPGYNNNTGLESLAYEYNVNGYMLGMNRGYAKDANNTNFFGFDLGYDKATNGIIGNLAYNNPQYNGNIAGMVWKSKGDGEKRKYDFSYDAMNRLAKADFSQYTNSSFNLNAGVDFSVGGDPVSGGTMKYDLNGNILEMWQKGLKITGSDWVDKLQYGYYAGSNKLRTVVDQNNNPQTNLGDFRTSSLHPQSGVKTFSNINNITDYTYDVNGNLKKDLNKDIGTASAEDIIYNHLNLPQTISFRKAGGAVKGTINYVYDANGNKLKKTTEELNVQVSYNNVNYTTDVYVTTTYIDNKVFESKSYSNTSLIPLQYYENLLFVSNEDGRLRVLYNNNTPKQAYSCVYDYMIKDHLGNVRMVLTEEQKTDDYLASMEVARRSIEEALFTNIGNTESDLPNGYPTDTYTSPNLKVAQVRGDGQKVGPGVMLKVMAGDKFNLRVSSWYNLNGTPPLEPTGFINDLLFMLSYGVQQATGGHTTQSDLQNSGVLTPGANAFLVTQNSFNTNRPKAFVNWVLFDEQFKFVASNSNAEQVGADQVFTTLIRNDLAVSKNGYLYIYVSNETPNISVFFDNLQVTHSRGPLLEETHYYPFGLEQKGISSKALQFGTPENKYKYNGIEKENDLGLEIYDTPLRELDGQVGRWWQIDPKVESMEIWSPYASNYNNPILFNDPLGDEPGCCRELWNDIKSAAKETFNTIADGATDFYNNGILPGVDWINHNLNPVYDVWNAGYSHFTGNDFLNQTPVNTAQTKTDAIIAIIPGAKIEGAIAKQVEKKVVGEGIEKVEKEVATDTYGKLRKEGANDAHHTIQDAAVKDIPGYSRNNAPAVKVEGPSNVVGTPHYRATQIQRQAGGGTYAAERRIAYKALRAAGFSSDQAKAAVRGADAYFKALGINMSSVLRIPGNR